METTIYRAAIGGLGPWEILAILVVVLIVFGAGKLPKVGSSLGEALKNFKKSISENDKDHDDENKGG